MLAFMCPDSLWDFGATNRLLTYLLKFLSEDIVADILGQGSPTQLNMYASVKKCLNW